MSAVRFSVNRPIATCVVVVSLCLFGALALFRLPVQLLPDLTYPTLTIQTEYPDAAPVSVEQFVTRPIEEAVGVIAGVRDLRSTSRAGLSEVTLEFGWDEKIDFTSIDVREKLGLVELPREAGTPRVLRYDPSLDPILRLGFTGARPLDELRLLAERWIKPRLEAVKGVAAAKVRGGLEPEIVVEADLQKLSALGFSVDDIESALARSNVNLPGGTLQDWGALYLVRTMNEYETLDDIRATVVREDARGIVRVEDVAAVARGHRDVQEVSRFGGREAVELAIHREGSANTVQVSQTVRSEIDAFQKEMPPDLTLTVLTDQSRYIADAIGQVRSAAFLGGILAIIVLYFFLKDLWATFIISLSIPTSVLVAFLPLHHAGVTLNIMSLGGLALGVGMLVDNSIVVLESIDRHRLLGKRRREAAAAGAGDVVGAVTASTLTTVAVFFPIAFVQGIAGQLFYDLSVTVCVSLIASLVVSLTLVPSLAALEIETARAGAGSTLFAWDRPGAGGSARGAWAVSRMWRSVEGVAAGRRTGAGRMLGALLRSVLHVACAPAYALSAVFEAVVRALYVPVARLSRVAIAGRTLPPLGDGSNLAGMGLTVLLYPARLLVLLALLGVRTILTVFTGAIDVVTYPLFRAWTALARAYPGMAARVIRHRGVTLAAALVLFGFSMAALRVMGTNLIPDFSQGEFAMRLRFPAGTPLAATTDVVERIEEPLRTDPMFERIFSVVGSLPSAATGRQTLGENLAQINFVLSEKGRANGEAPAAARVREVLSRFPAAEAEMVRPSVLSMSPPVKVEVFADDLGELDAAAARVEQALRSVSGIRDVSTSVEAGSPEIIVTIDRERSGALGVSADDLAQSLRRKIRGVLAGKFREEEHRLDIRLRGAASSRDRAALVERLPVRLPGGTTVPVSAVAGVQEARGPGAIHRTDGARVAEVTAKIDTSDLGRMQERVRAAVRGLDLPPGVTAELSGQEREMAVSFRSLYLAMALAVFLVYVVMAAQFESLLHPFVILLTVPLGAIGVTAGLLVTGTEISVLVLIGAVILAGIVVNNAIVLVDAVNRRRREGGALEESIVAAGGERLRPILMTTLTTVLGLAPMALGIGAGSELQAPLAITVIAGLSSATLLTLIVIPCVYRVFTSPKGLEGGAP